MAERHVEIIPDDRVAERIPQATWQGIIDGLLIEIRAGQMVGGGLAAAIPACVAVLREQFPPGADRRDKIVDRVTDA